MNTRMRMPATKRALSNRRRGQSLVEFALAIPFILLIIVAIMYFGRVFYVKQAVLLATQEAARDLSRIPSELLDSPVFLENRVGYTSTGQATNGDSVASGILGAANLLSGGKTGDLPPGSRVDVYYLQGSALPSGTSLPQGAVAVRISYPFKFIGDPFGNSASEFGSSIDVWSGEGGDPVSFSDFDVSELTVSVKEIL